MRSLHVRASLIEHPPQVYSDNGALKVWIAIDLHLAKLAVWLLNVGLDVLTRWGYASVRRVLYASSTASCFATGCFAAAGLVHQQRAELI